jgi:hypothetical protein
MLSLQGVPLGTKRRPWLATQPGNDIAVLTPPEPTLLAVVGSPFFI